MRIFLDTEFTDLVGIIHETKLISAGLVADDGQECYVELLDQYDRDECSDFVHEAVLPHLRPEKHGLRAPEAAARIKAWIEAFGEPVEIVTDSPGYDFGLVANLLRDHDCWPANLPPAMPKRVDPTNVDPGIERYFQYQPMAIRHHAGWDARALAYAVEELEENEAMRKRFSEMLDKCKAEKESE